MKEQIARLYSPNAQQRVDACRELEKMKAAAAPAVPFLVSLLPDGAEGTISLRGHLFRVTPGREVSRALAEIGDAAVAPLIVVLRDPTFQARDLAARSLGQIGDHRAVDPLLAVRDDRDPTLRSSVAYALGQPSQRRWSRHWA